MALAALGGLTQAEQRIAFSRSKGKAESVRLFQKGNLKLANELPSGPRRDRALRAVEKHNIREKNLPREGLGPQPDLSDSLALARLRTGLAAGAPSDIADRTQPGSGGGGGGSGESVTAAPTLQRKKKKRGIGGGTLSDSGLLGGSSSSSSGSLLGG